MANLKKCDFMVHPNELRKCIIEIDEVWHELSQQQRYLAEITNQIHCVPFIPFTRKMRV